MVCRDLGERWGTGCMGTWLVWTGRAGGHVPPGRCLLVAAQLMEPVEFLAAFFGVRDERELEAGGRENGVHVCFQVNGGTTVS